MRKFALLCVLGLLCSLFVAPAFFASAPPALASRRGDVDIGIVLPSGAGLDGITGTYLLAR
jgi:hypothetical protein